MSNYLSPQVDEGECLRAQHGGLVIEPWIDNVTGQSLLRIQVTEGSRVADILIRLHDLNDMLEKIGFTAIERRDQP